MKPSPPARPVTAACISGNGRCHGRWPFRVPLGRSQTGCHGGCPAAERPAQRRHHRRRRPGRGQPGGHCRHRRGQHRRDLRLRCAAGRRSVQELSERRTVRRLAAPARQRAPPSTAWSSRRPITTTRSFRPRRCGEASTSTARSRWRTASGKRARWRGWRPSIGVVTQMGTQGHAFEGTRRAVEVLRAGSSARSPSCTSGPTGRPAGGRKASTRPADTPPVPEGLDWDVWLGPAPERPYNPAYVPFKWRGFWDFGTGAIGDMGIHNLDTAYWGLELGAPTFGRRQGLLAGDRPTRRRRRRRRSGASSSCDFRRAAAGPR